MRAAIALLLVGAAAAGIWFAVNKIGASGEPKIVGVRGPDGTAARSLVVMGGAEGAARNLITVYEPRDGARAPLASLSEVRFRWASVPGAQSYLFVANNEFGELIWRSHVKDTTLALPDKARTSLIAGDRLKWIVQAPTLSASSDLQRLTLD